MILTVICFLFCTALLGIRLAFFRNLLRRFFFLSCFFFWFLTWCNKDALAELSFFHYLSCSGIIQCACAMILSKQKFAFIFYCSVCIVKGSAAVIHTQMETAFIFLIASTGIIQNPLTII